MVFNLTGGGTQLNFKVLAFSTKEELLAAQPKENTIGLVTTTEITNWIFSAEEPSEPTQGLVWIKISSESDMQFNALKKNGLIVYPNEIQQYNGEAWEKYNFYIYQDGEWNGISTIPVFTYTGEYEVVNDNDEPIQKSADNWKIRFLTSGDFTISVLNGAAAGIDAFLVGGGGGAWGGGGGGGYTATQKKIAVTVGETYAITIGAGGTATSTSGNDGGNTSAFGYTASGGAGARSSNNGGAGGSGGGGFDAGAGGSDGSNGEDGWGSTGGSGQGSTTREFAEESGKLYAGGGGGGLTGDGPTGQNGDGGDGGGGSGSEKESGGPGTENSGGGGGGTNQGTTGGAGGSGIVVIRNAR